MPARSTTAPSAVRGFTLIEVLVALVVMSVGMLGIAALYLEGLRAGRTAIYRTTAVNLAADMADRIRANQRAGNAYAGNGPGADQSCVNGDEDCTPAELASDDWFSWSSQIDAQLPEGASAEILASAGPAPVYTITLRWPEIGQTEAASYSLSLQP
ncbi:MAG: type IV pilus modification protein PilV [Gammaproteobacteria bacterium]